MRKLIHIWILLLICSCGKRTVDERHYYTRHNKQPYGCFIFHDYIKNLFSESDWKYEPYQKKTVKGISDLFNRSQQVPEKNQLYIVYKSSFNPQMDEAHYLNHFVKAGGNVLLLCSFIGEDLQDNLGIGTGELLYQEGILSVTDFGTDKDTFHFPGQFRHKALDKVHDGDALKWLFTEEQYPIGIGKISYNLENGKIGGKIIVVTSPTIFSNYFLLHKNNARILGQLNTLLPVPDDIARVYWNDMGTHNTFQTGSAMHSLSIIFGIPALKWAFWIFISVFIMIYLFNIKRRFRKINPPAPVVNHSLKFINTIALLYLQKGDHLHMAKKMKQFFYEHVYLHYQLRSDGPDQEWWDKLQIRSGTDQITLTKLKKMFFLIDSDVPVSDEFLEDFHSIIQSIYIKSQ